MIGDTTKQDTRGDVTYFYVSIFVAPNKFGLAQLDFMIGDTTKQDTRGGVT